MLAYTLQISQWAPCPVSVFYRVSAFLLWWWQADAHIRQRKRAVYMQKKITVHVLFCQYGFNKEIFAHPTGSDAGALESLT